MLRSAPDAQKPSGSTPPHWAQTATGAAEACTALTWEESVFLWTFL